MKCLSVRVIASGLLLVSTVVSPVLAWSMSEMTDSQLSTTTGQDGITIFISPPTLTLAQKTALGVTQTNGLQIGAAILHDKDGIAASPTYNKGGALIFGDAKQANSANIAGVQMGVFGSTPITVNIDASGNAAAVSAVPGGRAVSGTAPVLNVNIAMPSDLLIRTGDISLEASNRSVPAIPVGSIGAKVANASVGGTKGGAYKIFNSLDITLGTAVTVNLQLGNTPQGGMISFGNLLIADLTVAGSLASPNCVYAAGVCTPTALNPASSLGFTAKLLNLDMTGLVVSVTKDVVGAITGTAAPTPVGGLLITDSNFTIGGIQLNNVMAGNACAAPCAGATIAPGMANGILGSFGVTNLAVTNLKISVSGM